MRVAVVLVPSSQELQLLLAEQVSLTVLTTVAAMKTQSAEDSLIVARIRLRRRQPSNTVKSARTTRALLVLLIYLLLLTNTVPGLFRDVQGNPNSTPAPPSDLLRSIGTANAVVFCRTGCVLRLGPAQCGCNLVIARG